MLIGISGSLREKSVNRKLIREAGRLYGGPFEEAEIRFPLYDGDLEDYDGVPADVIALADKIKAAEAVVISTPEYNQSFSGVLKNALDWLSRTDRRPWVGKPVALLSAAAGRAGGARANYALRLAMTPFRPRLLPFEMMLAGASKEFGEDGKLTSERYLAQLSDIMAELKSEVQRGA